MSASKTLFLRAAPFLAMGRPAGKAVSFPAARSNCAPENGAMATYPFCCSSAWKASQASVSPWLMKTTSGLRSNASTQFSSPFWSAWPLVPCSTAISAFTAISSPNSRTSFTPSSSARPSVPFDW